MSTGEFLVNYQQYTVGISVKYFPYISFVEFSAYVWGKILLNLLIVML